MVAFKFLTAAAFAGAAMAAPIVERDAALDATVLQFALTLEHLENYFYKMALSKFGQSDFVAAGYSADYYNDIRYIAYDEATHVTALTAAIKAAGYTPVEPCTYNIVLTTVKDFITLSSIIESVGTSAYLGAAPLISSDAYLTVAGAILAVEAEHTSVQRLAIGKIPFPNPFQTPLDPNAVYTLALAFIKSCPSSNYKFPFTQFASLSVVNQYGSCEQPKCSSPDDYLKRTMAAGPPSPGARVTFLAAKTIPKNSYVTFVNGLQVTSVKGSVYGKKVTATIPAGNSGQTYVFISKTDQETTFDATNVLFGPAILEVQPAAQ